MQTLLPRFFLSFLLVGMILVTCTSEASPTVSAITPTYPQLSTVPPPTLTPPALQSGVLKTAIVLSVQEKDQQIFLNMQTEKIFGCVNYLIEEIVSFPSQNQINIKLTGIPEVEPCLTIMGPTHQSIHLNVEDSITYELTITDTKQEDRYWLTVAPELIALEPIAHSFTWPEYTSWRRLPEKTVWFLFNLRETNDQKTLISLSYSTYEATINQFLQQVENIGGQPLNLEQGVYAAPTFLPPWLEWWQQNGDYFSTPLENDSIMWGKWVVVRYYYFPGDLSELEILLKDFNANISFASVRGYTSQGEDLENK
jgi:hypothetical protein